MRNIYKVILYVGLLSSLSWLWFGGYMQISKESLFQDHQVMGLEWERVADEYNTAQLIAKSAADKAAKLKDQLIEMSHGKSSMRGCYVFTVGDRKGSIQYDKIPELKSVDLEKYRKENTTVWLFKKI